ncbi:methyltransferase domain-containing protein [Sulfitobacter sp. MF3-043]|uniref:methyltransferase domain-containing protein n=1 Tax=Sulfitobacter sediminivivens TaxID=3252902 RepID=UPI0036D988E8
MSSGFYNAEMAAKQEQMAKTKDMVRQRDEIIRSLSPVPGETILELGSGNGILVRELIEAVGPEGRVVGLDASEAILEMARHICPKGEFFHGDAQSLPFEDETFDAVVAAQVFCFLDNLDRAIAETYRVLKPGGRLLVLDTDWDSLIWKSDNPDLMARVMKVYQAVYSDAHLPRSLPSMLAQAGFSKIEVESFVVLNTGFGEDTYARQSAEFATSIMESSVEFTPEEQNAWLNGQKELARTGAFFFSLNRYLISAQK